MLLLIIFFLPLTRAVPKRPNLRMYFMLKLCMNDLCYTCVWIGFVNLTCSCLLPARIRFGFGWREQQSSSPVLAKCNLTGPLPLFHIRRIWFHCSTDGLDHFVQNRPRSDLVLADHFGFWPNGSGAETSWCARIIGPGHSGKTQPARFLFPTSDSPVPFYRRPQTAQIMLCKTGPDLIWFCLTMSDFGQTDPVRKQAGVQDMIIGPGSGITKPARYQFPAPDSVQFTSR